MWRSFFLAIALLNSTTLSSLAGEPRSIIVVVPDPDTAAVVSAKAPGVRIGVLQVHANESDETVNARAVALRHATHLVFDHSNETLRLAMFRERLQMQGVIAINIESFIFEARRPFHPERFALALSFDDGILAGVMRSKGYCWLATHHGEAFRWSQSGVSIKMDLDGPWMCTVDESEWPDDEASREWIMATMPRAVGRSTTRTSLHRL
ncbi:MAG: GTP-binding protein [Pirellula sp.]|jgi:G3E family GTPase